MTRNVRLNHIGMSNLAHSIEIQGMCRAAAERIAEHLRGQGIRVGDRDGGPREYELPVKVREGIYDGRAFSDVIIQHPSGAAVQAKHGALTKAASAEGLRVR